MEEQSSNPLKAIKKKCLDCCCDQLEEVKLCTCEGCPLYPFRLGKNPYRKKRILTEQQRVEMSNRLKQNKKNACNSHEKEEI